MMKLKIQDPLALYLKIKTKKKLNGVVQKKTAC